MRYRREWQLDGGEHATAQMQLHGHVMLLEFKTAN